MDWKAKALFLVSAEVKFDSIFLDSDVFDGKWQQVLL
jgi:hypothetical protein